MYIGMIIRRGLEASGGLILASEIALGSSRLLTRSYGSIQGHVC
jgi:hypothetical protein